VAGVDAGSRRVRCVVGVVEDRRLRFLGAGTAVSQGWNRGRAQDVALIAESIQAAVKEAEERAGADIESAVLGIGGPAVQSIVARGVYEFGRTRPVTQDDLKYAIDLASRARLEEDRMLLHVFPQQFSLDGKAGYRTPVGVPCSRLEATVLLVTVSEKEHESMVAAAHQAHLAVRETASEAVAAAYAAILPRERHHGAALVDIGLHSSEVVVYDGESTIGVASLPVSGEHFTRDLVVAMAQLYGHPISPDDAELLKCEYGCALRGLTADNVLVEVPSADGRSSKEFSRRQINEILEARAEEMFAYIKEYVAHLGMEQGLLEGLFVTGGGARLDGMLDMAERVLNCPARYGLAQGVQDWPPGFQDQAWTTAAGLALYSARLEAPPAGKSGGLLGFLGW
jgi:cell division protein FtsA